MGKNKNKKNKQNSAGGNRFGSGPFNKKFKQDKPMNNNQGMKKDKGAVNGGNKRGGFNKKKAFDGGDKFEGRLMNEKFGVKKDGKNENTEVSNFQKQRPKENKMNKDGFSQPNKDFGQKTTPNTSVSSMGKESPKEASGKKKVKFETDSSERNEHVKNDLVIKGDAQAKRFGSPRETPPSKRVKLETLTNSFSKDNELNGNAKKDTKVKKDGNVKNVFDNLFSSSEFILLMTDKSKRLRGALPPHFFDMGELVDLNITGYNISTNTSNCIVLNAQKDYSTAANPFKLFKFSADTEHSVQVGLKVLQWILSPIVTDTFFNDILQKRVLVLKRATNAYFDGFFNIGDFKDMLKNNNVLYGKDVNVASYVSGVRQTHNPLKKEMQRATITSALQHFQNGRSLQCVHPQVFNDKIWYICDALQEVFCSYVGANNYLTPAGAAGFAPHYDNIDAFILQTEGRKHWKIYAPESLDDTLPLESSDNLNESDFMEREPVFDGWLDQGDVLYVPRGFIHQANTGQDKLSHHVTISICRKFSYAHFFEKASSEFILLMTEKSKRLRGALPPHFFDMGGMADIAYPNEDSLNNKLIPYAKIFFSKIRF
uniref:Bifunctional lysine-specific demethylase and histidyl-hydroxylase n=1 Tax=Meloidogyne enterolobii TaxID=390850 RepID=A0A6V7XKE0_MELEN|nr:unnamed protein product [Meloidogyne enterolobii]